MKSILAFALIFFAQSSFALYTPQQALKDALSEPLTYVGQYIPFSSISGKFPDCVFKNSKVMVISGYCVSRAIPAAKVVVLSNNVQNGYVRMYAEINEGAKDVSRATRKEYIDVLFSASSIIATQPFSIDMPADKIDGWMKTEYDSGFQAYCVTAGSLDSFPNLTACKNIPNASDAEAWTKAGYKFFKTSDRKFPKLLKLLKSKVPSQN